MRIELAASIPPKITVPTAPRLISAATSLELIQQVTGLHFGPFDIMSLLQKGGDARDLVDAVRGFNTPYKVVGLSDRPLNASITPTAGGLAWPTFASAGAIALRAASPNAMIAVVQPIVFCTTFMILDPLLRTLSYGPPVSVVPSFL